MERQKKIGCIASLKSSLDFKRVFNAKQRVFLQDCIIYYRKGKEMRLGISISKKIGNACQRNRVKRVIREVVKSSPIDLEMALVFKSKFYPEFCFNLFKEEYLRFIRKVHRLNSEKERKISVENKL